MATGKPPWSQQYQEVAVLYHIGTTKSHPPIPEHLSPEAKDFLLKCLQKEPNLRSTASELLRHPFVTGNSRPTCSSSITKPSPSSLRRSRCNQKDLSSPILSSEDCQVLNSMEDINVDGSSSTYQGNLISSRPIWETSENENPSAAIRQSFNPMSEPMDDEWACKFDESMEAKHEFAFPCGMACEDDDEDTEMKIRAFLDDKALELKRLQTPLYEEFHNTMNASNSKIITEHEKTPNNLKMPPKFAPSPSRRGSIVTEGRNSGSPTGDMGRILREIPSPRLNELDGILEDVDQRPNDFSNNVCERRRQWKEELVQELASQREMMRQAGAGGRVSSPRDAFSNRKRERSKLASPGK